jgi:type II secretory pathway pseudopilin PulG
MKNKVAVRLVRQKGFTLVEILVYFGLFSILLVVINSLFITTLEQQTQDLARSALQQESEFVLAKLKYDIYNADSVSLPAQAGDVSDSLVFTTDGVVYTYQLDATKITKSFNGETYGLTSNKVNIDSLQFENQSGSSLDQIVGFTVIISSSQDDGRASSTRTISSSVTRR